MLEAKASPVHPALPINKNPQPPNPENSKKQSNRTPSKNNAYSPNALITSNRIPAKANFQSPSHGTLALGAPLLFPANFGRFGIFKSLPAVLWQLIEEI